MYIYIYIFIHLYIYVLPNYLSTDLIDLNEIWYTHWNPPPHEAYLKWAQSGHFKGCFQGLKKVFGP